MVESHGGILPHPPTTRPQGSGRRPRSSGPPAPVAVAVLASPPPKPGSSELTDRAAEASAVTGGPTQGAGRRDRAAAHPPSAPARRHRPPVWAGI